jgi:hypothetical protein
MNTNKHEWKQGVSGFLPAPAFGERGGSRQAQVAGNPGHNGGIRSFNSVRIEGLGLMNQ